MRLGVVSDPHWTTRPETRAAWHGVFDFAGLPARIDAARSAFERAPVDAVVMCGDLTHFGDERSARAVVERLTSGRRRPLVAVAGNHDCLERDDLLDAALGGRCRTFGAAAHDVEGVRVAGVAIATDGGPDELRWTGELERDGRPSVIVSHYPVLSRAAPLAERGLRYSGDLTNRADLHARVRDGVPVIALTGHIHARDSHAEDNVLQLSAGALIEAPYEVALVDVESAGGRLAVRRRVQLVGPPDASLDTVFAPADESWTFAGGAWRRAED